MPATLDPIRKELIKNSLREGSTSKDALLSAGYAPSTATHKISSKNRLLKVAREELVVELTDEKLINKLKEILTYKLNSEAKLFAFIDSHKEITKDNFKTICHAINKTKDNIAEITKTLRLVSGDSTEKIEFTSNRDDRLESMLKRIDITKKQPIDVKKVDDKP